MPETYRKLTIMTQESKLVIRAHKCAKIIQAICELYGVSLKEATDIFYRSETSALIDEGVADLQCRSERYLATIVWEEHTDN